MLTISVTNGRERLGFCNKERVLPEVHKLVNWNKHIQKK